MLVANTNAANNGRFYYVTGILVKRLLYRTSKPIIEL